MRYLFKIFLPLLLVVAGIAVYYGYIQFEQFKTSPINQDIESYEIKNGSNIRSIAKDLENRGLIKSAAYFTILSKIEKLDTKIKAGEYHLKADLTPADLLLLFSKGKTVQYKLRIPEGSRYSDIVQIIKNDKHLKHTLSDNDFKNIMTLLDTKYSHHQPEGWFFPDTYHFAKGMTDKQFLQRAHNTMQQVLDKLWKQQPKHVKGIKTPYDALILASIVEKETGHPKDRRKVARVFINRLAKNMLLQTDPTVIYGMGQAYNGNIRKKDLKKDTPYNTYMRKGLTPTPIATPGLASIEAVFNPEAGDMLYFVAKGDGTSYFSKNYTQHKKAVIKYLLNGKASRYKGD